MNTEREKKTPAKPTGRRYASVAELMRVEGVSDEVQKHYKDITNATRIVHQLTCLRHIAGLTQEQMAEKLGVTQSAISKLESGRDEDLTIGQMREYAKISGEHFGVMFGKPLNHVESVNFCVEMIRHHLMALATLAHKGNQAIETEIQIFFSDALQKILKIVGQCANALPNGGGERVEVRLELMGRKNTPAQALGALKKCAEMETA